MTDEEYRQQVEQRWKETMALLGVDDAGPAPEVAKPAEQPQPKLRPVVQAELPISGREWEPVPIERRTVVRQLRFLQSCTRQRNRTSKQHKLHRPMMDLATTEPAARGGTQRPTWQETTRARRRRPGSGQGTIDSAGRASEGRESFEGPRRGRGNNRQRSEEDVEEEIAEQDESVEEEAAKDDDFGDDEPTIPPSGTCRPGKN